MFIESLIYKFSVFKFLTIIILLLNSLSILASENSKNISINYLDTAVTYYVVSSPNPKCINNAECYSVYKLNFNKENKSDTSWYKINTFVTNNNQYIDFGKLKIDFNTDFIIWKKPEYNSTHHTYKLFDLSEQNRILTENLELNDTIVLVSKILCTLKNSSEINIETLFDFIIMIFYNNPVKEEEFYNNKPTVVTIKSGGTSYYIAAIKYKENLIFKSQNYHRFKNYIENN